MASTGTETEAETHSMTTWTINEVAAIKAAADQVDQGAETDASLA